MEERTWQIKDLANTEAQLHFHAEFVPHYGAKSPRWWKECGRMEVILFHS